MKQQNVSHIGTVKKVVERAINDLVNVFQHPDWRNRSWYENDLTCLLFYYLRLRWAKLLSGHDPMYLVRAEFPTRNKYHRRRGRYDLVVLDPYAWPSGGARVPFNTSDDKWLENVKVFAAIEVKLWYNQRYPPNGVTSWSKKDLQKLMDVKNRLDQAYYLNFAQYGVPRSDSKAQQNYQSLRKELTGLCKPPLNALCVPSDNKMQPEGNWISRSDQ